MRKILVIALVCSMMFHSVVYAEETTTNEQEVIINTVEESENLSQYATNNTFNLDKYGCSQSNEENESVFNEQLIESVITTIDFDKQEEVVENAESENSQCNDFINEDNGLVEYIEESDKEILVINSIDSSDGMGGLYHRNLIDLVGKVGTNEQQGIKGVNGIEVWEVSITQLSESQQQPDPIYTLSPNESIILKLISNHGIVWIKASNFQYKYLLEIESTNTSDTSNQSFNNDSLE